MQSRNPNDIETTKREEMMCPECWTRGLIEHPGYSSEYNNQQAKVVKATRCPNEDCRYHSRIPPSEIEQQYKEPSLLKLLIQGIFGSDSGDEEDKRKDVKEEDKPLVTKKGAFIGIIVLGMLAYGFLLNPSGGGFEVSDIEGEVTGIEGQQPLSDIYVRELRTGSDYNTTEDGLFGIEVANQDSVIEFVPEEESIYEPHAFEFSYQEDSIQLQGVDDEVIDSGGENLSFKLPLEASKNYTRFATEGTLSINSLHPETLEEDIEVDIRPRSGTITQQRNIEKGSNTVTVSGDLISSSGEIDIGTTTETVTIDGTASEESPVSNIDTLGNLDPINAELEVDGIVTTTDSVEQRVNHRGTITEEFSEENPINLAVTLTGISDRDTRERFGTMSRDSPLVLNIDSESSPSTFSLSITGNTDSENVSEEGVIEDNTVRENLGGNIQPENVSIDFKGGLTPEATVGTTSIREDAELGDSDSQRQVFEADQNSIYRIEIENEGGPDSLWSAGYSINNDRKTVTNDTEIIDLELESGDSVHAWANAEIEDTQAREKDFTLPERYPLELESVNVPTEVDRGESFDLEATLRNSDSSIYRVEVYGFTDGTQYTEEEFEFQPEQTKTVNLGEVSFSTEGIHTVSVNEGEQININVGDSELIYGEGEVSITAERMSTTGGTVRMDTTGNGEIDCVVQATDECSISDDIVQTGTNTFQAIVEDADDVSYSLDYTLKEGARDIEIDMNNDGNPDLVHDGILRDGSTVSETVELEEGNYQITPSESGKELNYEAQWDRIGAVNQPEVILNGEKVIETEENYRGSRTFSIPDVPVGENELEFRMDNEELLVELEWDREGVDAYPNVYSDAQVACLNQELAIEDSCEISNLFQDTDSLEFRGLDQDIEYTLTYTAQAIPQNVELQINEEEEQTYSSRTVDIETWNQQIRTDGLEEGRNIIQLNADDVNGISPELNGEIIYESEAILPRDTEINITTSQGNTVLEQEIPSEYTNEENELLDPYTLEIPRENLEPGNTNVKIKTSNQGVIEIETEFEATTFTNIDYEEE